MALIVQKYGGTSVGSPERIKNVAARIANYHAKGDQGVEVVSAMSGVTDNLIKLAKEIMPIPNEREMDVLHYLAGHLTVPEIAEALYLSPYTIRSHVKSIYGKLNAHNRSQAVQRAKELHLL